MSKNKHHNPFSHQETESGHQQNVQNEPANQVNPESQQDTPQEPQESPQEPSQDQTETQTPPADQLAALQARVQELEDLKLRQMAEFDNYRRRTNKEKLDLMETAGERIFTDILPLIDDFERALDSLRKRTAANQDNAEAAAMLEGVELIYQKFITFLKKNHVEPIETDGVDFSTNEHEAITTFAAGEDKKGKIIDCTQRGYKLGEKVIRYAKVVVGE